MKGPVSPFFILSPEEHRFLLNRNHSSEVSAEPMLREGKDAESKTDF